MDRTQHSQHPLTERQREVLRLIVRGHTNGEIADQLGISLQGAKWHVRELLGKFGVESREELVEAAATGRSPLARASRWMSALIPASLPGISASTVAGGVAVTITLAAAGIVMASRWNGDSLAAIPGATPAAVALVKPGASPAALPQVTGSIWTPQEALQHARQEVGAEIGVSSLDTDLGERIDLDNFTVTLFEWRPGTKQFDLGDGDRYWEDRDGTGKDLWYVRWEANAPTASLHVPSPVTVSVDTLVEDGATTRAVKAFWVSLVDRNGATFDLGGSFESRAMTQRFKEMSAPAGPMFPVAAQNAVAGGPTLEVFLTSFGAWCYAWPDGGRGCGFDPGKPDYPLTFGVGSAFDPKLGIGHTYVTVTAARTVSSIRVLPGDGRDLAYALFDPPEGVPAGSRFAYLELGPSLPADKITVIAYDAAGNELGRRTGPGLPAPAGANGP